MQRLFSCHGQFCEAEMEEFSGSLGFRGIFVVYTAHYAANGHKIVQWNLKWILGLKCGLSKL